MNPIVLLAMFILHILMYVWLYFDDKVFYFRKQDKNGMLGKTPN